MKHIRSHTFPLRVEERIPITLAYGAEIVKIHQSHKNKTKCILWEIHRRIDEDEEQKERVIILVQGNSEVSPDSTYITTFLVKVENEFYQIHAFELHT